MIPSGDVQSVAIVGAGMAGITCAVSLSVQIPKVVVFERFTYPGGRMAVHREDGFEFDYGAQYFTAHNDVFAAHVENWSQAWLVDEWRGWRVDLNEGHAFSREDAATFYLGRPGMDSMIHHSASLCDVLFGTTITHLERKAGKWSLRSTGGQCLGEFDAVVFATPPAEALQLLKYAPKMAEQLGDLKTVPCWAVMLGFSEPLTLGYDAAYIVDQMLSWVARNSSKPERSGRESWVLHASNEWSELHGHENPTDVVRQLYTAFKRVTGEPFKMPAFAKAYYWPYALAVDVLNQGCLYDAEMHLGACGDWCVSARVEGAFLSGLAMAERILLNE